MSVFRWRYDETCEGRYCCGDCDKCDKEDEPVDDLISRQAAIDAMTEYYWSIMGDEPPKLDEKTALYVDLKQAVKRLPTADLSEYSDKLWKTAYERGKAEAHPKKGEWVAFANEGGELDLRCSVCGEEQGFFFGYFNYCPNCGAKMEELA